MTADVTLTLAEAAAILEPPLTEQQLRRIIQALGWPPDAVRHTGRPGKPVHAYNAARLMQLHAALVPFTRITALLCGRDRMP